MSAWKPLSPSLWNGYCALVEDNCLFWVFTIFLSVALYLCITYKKLPLDFEFLICKAFPPCRYQSKKIEKCLWFGPHSWLDGRLWDNYTKMLYAVTRCTSYYICQILLRLQTTKYLFSYLIPIILISVIYCKIGLALVQQNRHIKNVGICFSNSSRRRHIQNRQAFVVCLIAVLSHGISILRLSLYVLRHIFSDQHPPSKDDWIFLFGHLSWQESADIGGRRKVSDFQRAYMKYRKNLLKFCELLHGVSNFKAGIHRVCTKVSSKYRTM